MVLGFRRTTPVNVAKALPFPSPHQSIKPGGLVSDTNHSLLCGPKCKSRHGTTSQSLVCPYPPAARARRFVRVLTWTPWHPWICVCCGLVCCERAIQLATRPHWLLTRGRRGGDRSEDFNLRDAALATGISTGARRFRDKPFFCRCSLAAFEPARPRFVREQSRQRGPLPLCWQTSRVSSCATVFCPKCPRNSQQFEGRRAAESWSGACRAPVRSVGGSDPVILGPVVHCAQLKTNAETFIARPNHSRGPAVWLDFPGHASTYGHYKPARLMILH